MNYKRKVIFEIKFVVIFMIFLIILFGCSSSKKVDFAESKGCVGYNEKYGCTEVISEVIQVTLPDNLYEGENGEVLRKEIDQFYLSKGYIYYDTTELNRKFLTNGKYEMLYAEGYPFENEKDVSISNYELNLESNAIETYASAVFNDTFELNKNILNIIAENNTNVKTYTSLLSTNLNKWEFGFVKMREYLFDDSIEPFNFLIIAFSLICTLLLILYCLTDIPWKKSVLSNIILIMYRLIVFILFYIFSHITVLFPFYLEIAFGYFWQCVLIYFIIIVIAVSYYKSRNVDIRDLEEIEVTEDKINEELEEYY